MGRDYYGILGVPRTATSNEIRAGYKWTSMKWHPQKNPGSKVEAEQRFRDIAEAYDVLINPARRRQYDEQGERGLKFPGAGSPYQYVGDPFALFVQFFSDANPLLPASDLSINVAAPSLSKKEAEAPIEVEVQCSLAEVQDGATRRVVVERTRIDSCGTPYKECHPITLPIRAGWEVGTRVNFRGEGNQTSLDKQPGDLVVIIARRPFPTNDHGEAESGQGISGVPAVGSNPSTWSALLGVDGNVAKKAIETVCPDLEVQLVPEGSMVSMDVRTDRVRIWVDGQNKVAKAPITG